LESGRQVTEKLVLWPEAMKANIKNLGFSLIEMLVVVLVIVLLTSVVSLNVGSGGSEIERDQSARRLASLMSHAQVEAEFSGADHGLYFEQVSGRGDVRYRAHWLRLYDQGWAETKGNTALAEPIIFPEGSEIFLSLSSDPDVEITVRPIDLRPTPQVVFYASGEVTEGGLEWMDASTGSLLYQYEWDLLGRIDLLLEGEGESILASP
jgi:general secretion pathway protein H